MARSPQTTRITLDIRDHDKKTEGWTYASGVPSGKVYRYSYEGGANGKGHVRSIVDDGPVDVEVRLKHVGAGFAIADITFPMDPEGQFDKGDVSPAQASFHNKNDKVQQGYYCVVVAHGGDTISCDPMISNDPRG